MIITKLVLENYGLFRGRNVFTLEPTTRRSIARPITIVGGKNGSGKTTLLEAVRVAFYGASALGARISQAEYAQFLNERIHRSLNGDLPVHQAKLELEFKHVHAGETNTYTIERGWTHTKGLDSLALYCNDQLVREPSSDQWQDFLKELLPPGLSQLYFFDAEKIEALANEMTSEDELASSFKSLLGLDVVERLQNDLTIYLTRQPGKKKNGSLAAQYRALEEQRQVTEKQRADRVQDKAHHMSQVSLLKTKLERLEQQIAAEGGTYAQKRQQAQVRRKHLEIEIKQIEEAIREICAELLPFVLATPLTRQLKLQLQFEAESQRTSIAYEAMSQTTQQVVKRIKDSSFWDGLSLTPKSRQQVSRRIQSALAEVSRHQKPLTQESIHNLSSIETSRLLEWISRAETDTPRRLLEHIQSLERLNAELHDCIRTLQSVPNEDALKPLLSQYQEASQELARQEQLLAQAGTKLQETLRVLVEIEREMKQARETLNQQEGSERRGEMARRTLRMLSDYQESATRLKIQNLEQILVESFNQLARKKEFIAGAQIDPHTFSVALTLTNGQRISQSRLSAGEKQIYAIAMLWALRKVSGRPLPVIIDTPLGRLDSDHRQQLVSHYFPNASHQVILLSTDTEIDQRYFDNLRPGIARTYHLEYDRKHGCTNVDEGYFWSHNGKG